MYYVTVNVSGWRCRLKTVNTYFGGPWCLPTRSLAVCSGCRSLAGKCLHWGRCRCRPRVSGCQCCGPGSPWCWCAARPQTGRRLWTGCSGCLRARRWDQQDPDLDERREKEREKRFFALSVSIKTGSVDLYAHKTAHQNMWACGLFFSTCSSAEQYKPVIVGS